MTARRRPTSRWFLKDAGGSSVSYPSVIADFEGETEEAQQVIEDKDREGK